MPVSDTIKTLFLLSELYVVQMFIASANVHFSVKILIAFSNCNV